MPRFTTNSTQDSPSQGRDSTLRERMSKMTPSNRSTNRFSQLQSLAAANDTEIEDELARGKKDPSPTPQRSAAELRNSALDDSYSPILTPLLPSPSPSLSRSAQKRLRDLKARISAQSKKNFVLERDVRYLDSRIALLIQNVSSSFLPRPAVRYMP